MGSSRQLTLSNRGGVIALKQAGFSNTYVANHMLCDRSTVSKIYSAYLQTGQEAPTPRSGRPCKLSSASLRVLKRDLLKYPGKPWKSFAIDLGVSSTTIRRVAHTMGFHKRIMRKRPFLRRLHKTNRMKWAKEMIGKDWAHTIFTDESSIEIGECVGPDYTIRRAGEENLERHILPTFKSGRQTLMVWGAISLNHKFPLVRLPLAPSRVAGGIRIKAEGLNGQRYSDLILRGPLAEACTEMMVETNGDVGVVEDSAPCHSSKVAKACRVELGINRISHPSMSPDLNAIEPMWYDLKRRIGKYRPVASTLDILWEHCLRAWEEIPMKTLNKHIEAMEERRVSVIRNKGGHTGF